MGYVRGEGEAGAGVEDWLMLPSSTVVDAVQCPKCNGESHVIDSRDGETARRRRRRCDRCRHRYTTYEIHAEEYERIQNLEVSTAQIEVAISVLCAIRTQLERARR